MCVEITYAWHRNDRYSRDTIDFSNEISNEISCETCKTLEVLNAIAFSIDPENRGFLKRWSTTFARGTQSGKILLGCTSFICYYYILADPILDQHANNFH